MGFGIPNNDSGFHGVIWCFASRGQQNLPIPTNNPVSLGESAHHEQNMKIALKQKNEQIAEVTAGQTTSVENQCHMDW